MRTSAPGLTDERGTPTLFGSCPHCRGEVFRAERLGDIVAFRCASCDAAWQYELGYVHRVA